MAWIVAVLVSLLGAGLAACSGETEDAADTSSAVAVPGRWSLPADVAREGAKVRLRYDEAPLWKGTSACSGRLQIGARKLGTYLAGSFAEIASIGGYACRRNTADGSRMSVHGTGRAMDVFIPKINGQADNSKGDKVANWLVVHAQEIGVQLVIWDRSIWRGNGTNVGAYGGPHPHDDHIHVELTLEAGAAKTDWFTTMMMDAGDAGDDDDGGMDDGDAGEDPDLDAGDMDDASMPVDAGAKDASVARDAAAPDVTPDAAAPADDAGASDWEVIEGDDTPGDTESVQKTRPTSKRGGAQSGDSEAIANSGCSAARAPGSSAGGALLLAAALLLGSRRRRS